MQTSWENSAKKYGKLVGKEGSYYHQSVIFPKLLEAMALTPKSSVLDLGCGQGVFSRIIPPDLTYFGLDISPSLIQQAKRLNTSKAYFKVQDVGKPFRLTKANFSHVVFILSLQNMEDLHTAIKNAASHLSPKGRLFIVLNHPVFRIPKHTDWDTHPQAQYRRIASYMSPLKIPIDMNPGTQTQETLTWSFHHSLSDFMKVFRENKLVIEDLDEWVSDKISVGKNAKRENVAREEIPMFMVVVLKKAA
jgi:SAM-dependent methyltransferase